MTTRIRDMPVYAAREEQVDATLYNLWRRARLHLKLPMRIELSGLKSMVLIVEHDCWVVVDERQFDLPVLAWLDFQDSGRDSLHTTVNCTLNYYHYMASHPRGKALIRMREILEKKLAAAGSPDRRSS